jgi:MFS family permease
MIFLGYAVGGPLWGWLSDKIHRRIIPMMLGCLFATASLAAVIYMPTLSYYGLLTLLFSVGACTSAKIIVFALGRDYNIHAMTGTSVAFTNMVIMLGGAIFQPVIGKMLDSAAGGPMLTAGQVMYRPEDYASAMAILPITLFVSSIMICFLKETYCRQVEQ